MAQLAFLGAGNMGRPMIANMLRAGHEVAVYNRTRGKVRELEAAGARYCATAREAVVGASAILAMVIDDQASRACWTGPDGALAGVSAGDVLAIECSSLSRDWVLELAGLMPGGMRFVDCPVAGRPDAAAAAKLKVFAGGAVDDVARARAVVSAFAEEVIHFGGLGSGVAFKLIYNLLGASQIAALAEALYACESIGIDLQAAAQVFASGGTASAHVVRHAKWMASGNHPDPAQFTGDGRLKDLDYALALLAANGLRSASGDGAHGVFNLMRSLGMGDLNDSQVFEALRRHASGKRGMRDSDTNAMR